MKRRVSPIIWILVLAILAGVTGCLPQTATPSVQTSLANRASIAIRVIEPTPSGGTTAAQQSTGARTTARPATTQSPTRLTASRQASSSQTVLDKAGSYTTPEDVAAYLHTYGRLPANFLTKREAMERGWDSAKGNLWQVTRQMSIGGDVFGNFERRLPSASGRVWRECDVNYKGGFRGPERLVWSSDGLIYYTADHYQTFKRLY